MNTKYLSRRAKIKYKIRKKVSGTPDKPRLVVFRSAVNIYAQLIDDVNGKTLASVSSLEKELKSKIEGTKGRVGKSKIIGMAIAEKAKNLSIMNVVFDRNGYLYHGRVKALAEGAREGGLEF